MKPLLNPNNRADITAWFRERLRMGFEKGARGVGGAHAASILEEEVRELTGGGNLRN